MARSGTERNQASIGAHDVQRAHRLSHTDPRRNRSSTPGPAAVEVLIPGHDAEVAVTTAAWAYPFRRAPGHPGQHLAVGRQREVELVKSVFQQPDRSLQRSGLPKHHG